MAYSPSPYFIGKSDSVGHQSPFLSVTVISVSVEHGEHRPRFLVRMVTAVRLSEYWLVRSCLHSSCITRSPAGTGQPPGTESGAAEETRAQWRAGRILLPVGVNFGSGLCSAVSPLPHRACSGCYKCWSLEKWSNK